MQRFRELAVRTSPGRERYVDLLRALAILTVVIGHWLTTVVTPDEGGLSGFSALGELTWAHPLTWAFQVMPLFFVVGGYANAASLATHRERGSDATGWLTGRSARIVRPLTSLLLVLAGGAVLARCVGVGAEQVRLAVWLAAIPLWFLAAYLAVVLLTPLTHALHQRYGLLVPVVLAVLAAAGDAARLSLGAGVLAWGNYVFVWLAIHQVGFAWRDGRLPARPRVAVSLLFGGLTVVLLLTAVGPYPVSMVNVPGSVDNTSPPTFALLAFAIAQLGAALLLRDPAARWLQRHGPWTAVIAVNAVVLTVFLWHMSAVVLTAVALHSAGLLPTPPVDSAQWWLWRLPWLAALAVVLGVLIALFGRVEARARRRPSQRRPALAVAPGQGRVRDTLTVGGFAAVIVGLLAMITSGPSALHEPFGLPPIPIAAYLCGAVVLRLLSTRTNANRGGM